MKDQMRFIQPRSHPTGAMRRLYAKLHSQYQAMTATADDVEFEHVPKQKSPLISAAFLIMVHLFAVAMWFFHDQNLSKNKKNAEVANQSIVTNRQTGNLQTIEVLPQIGANCQVHRVVQGDNYATIAKVYGVSEADLKDLNKNVPIQTGLDLKIPAKKIAASETNDIKQVREASQPKSPSLLLKPIDDEKPPRAITIIEKSPNSKIHLVKAGETLSSIAKQYSITVKSLVSYNNIKDAKLLRVGTELKIPK